MATPLPAGGGGVAVMAGPVSPLDPSPSRTCLNDSALESPVLIFLLFHKAIRSELDGLHSAAVAVAVATNQESGADIKPLLERYQFLRAIYKHHCNAEDEVVFFLFFLFLGFVFLNMNFANLWIMTLWSFVVNFDWILNFRASLMLLGCFQFL